MGLDFGSRTCGVAMSDELLMTAQPVETIHRDRPSKIRKTLARIEELIETHNVGLIVLGLPLNMNDTQGERAAATLEFRDQLTRRTGLPVVMSDERLTTVEADGLLEALPPVAVAHAETQQQHRPRPARARQEACRAQARA